MKKKAPIERIDVRNITDPNIVKTLSYPSLALLCADIRREIIRQVSLYGGHLSPNLGTVELTVALYRVFDFPKDKLIFDVGHQCYTHKILSGRRLDHLNEPGYVQGFQKINESEYDPYEAGHSSTALSAAGAFAYARDLQGKDYNVIALVGDASMANGLSFEGLNDLAIRNHKVIIILNDNEMSISKPVGGIGRFFRKISTGKAYNSFKRRFRKTLSHNRFGAKIYSLSFSIKDAIKRKLVPLTMFDNLGFSYMGPFNGHNIRLLEKQLKRALVTDKSVVFHVRTIKGKGYKPSENDQTGYWHGVTPFDPLTGKPSKDHPGQITYSHLFADLTVQNLDKHKEAVLIIPAMVKGSGQEEAFIKFPERTIDVGIAEEHALTFAGALAINGYHPIVDIYSTFLQRAYDELSHDCARLGVDLTLLIDRSGLVGSNGETHQGIYDPAFLKSIPGVCLSMPATPEIAARLYALSFQKHGIFGIRYSRGYLVDDRLPDEDQSIEFGQFRYVNKKDNPRGVVVAIGPRVEEIGQALRYENLDVIDPVFLLPLNEQLIDRLVKYEGVFIYDAFGTYEGFAEMVVSSLAMRGYRGKILVKAIPNQFVSADSLLNQEKRCGVDLDSAVDLALTLL